MIFSPVSSIFCRQMQRGLLVLVLDIGIRAGVLF